MVTPFTKWLSDPQQAASPPHEDPEKEMILNREEALPRFANREELFQKALETVIQEYGNAGKTLFTLVQENKLEEGRFLAHTLRGVMGNIGADSAFATCSRLEDAFTQGPEDTINPLIEELDRKIAVLIHHIQQEDPRQT